MSHQSAVWNITLHTECPNCGDYFDIIRVMDDFWTDARFGACESNTPATTGVEVECPNCEHVFKVDFEYLGGRMTAQLSREIVENLLQHNDESDSPANAEAWEVNALCRMALAGMGSDKNARIAESLESLMWPNMAIGNKVIIKAAIDALRAAPPAQVAVPTFEEWCQMEDMKPLGWVREAMKEAYDACRAAMLKAGPVTRWIKCSERMPEQKQSNRYIGLNLLLNERTVVQGGFDDGSFWQDGVRIDNVTHWMPLPAAPEQEV